MLNISKFSKVIVSGVEALFLINATSLSLAMERRKSQFSTTETGESDDKLSPESLIKNIMSTISKIKKSVDDKVKIAMFLHNRRGFGQIRFSCCKSLSFSNGKVIINSLKSSDIAKNFKGQLYDSVNGKVRVTNDHIYRALASAADWIYDHLKSEFTLSICELTDALESYLSARKIIQVYVCEENGLVKSVVLFDEHEVKTKNGVQDISSFFVQCYRLSNLSNIGFNR